MKELLFSSMRHGLQHSCYQQLLDVRISRGKLIAVEGEALDILAASWPFHILKYHDHSAVPRAVTYLPGFTDLCCMTRL